MMNVHPRILEAVLAKLPKGAEVVGAVAESATQALFMVRYQGKIRRTLMAKADVAVYLGSQVVDIEVEEGSTLEEAVQRLSDKYRLFLLPKVDYAVGTGRIVFGDQPTVERSVTILKESVSLYGTLTFVLRNKGAVAKSCGVATPILDTQRAQIALAGHIFSVQEGEHVSGNKLTQGFSQSVLDYLKKHHIKVTPTLDDLVEGEVLDTLHDGISEFLAVKCANGVLWYIRFAVEHETV